MMISFLFLLFGVFLLYKGVQVFRSRYDSVDTTTMPPTPMDTIKAMSRHSTRKSLGVMMILFGFLIAVSGVVAVLALGSTHHR